MKINVIKHASAVGRLRQATRLCRTTEVLLCIAEIFEANSPFKFSFTIESFETCEGHACETTQLTVDVDAQPVIAEVREHCSSCEERINYEVLMVDGIDDYGEDYVQEPVVNNYRPRI